MLTAAVPRSLVVASMHSYLLRTPTPLSDGALQRGVQLRGHVVVLADNVAEHFTFCVVLRASHLSTRRFYAIVLVVEREPTAEEWATVAGFPYVYYLVGAHRRQETLDAACTAHAHRVVVMSDQTDHEASHDEHTLIDSVTTYVGAGGEGGLTHAAWAR